MKLIGHADQPVVEESRATIDAQMDALMEGTIPCIMLPRGSTYIPPLPEGIDSVETEGPGAGTYYFWPESLDAESISNFSERGWHGSLLGHLQSKDAIGKDGLALCAVLPSGVTVQDSAVPRDSPVMLELQTQILQNRHPTATVSVRDVRTVLKEREMGRQ